jgi:hypothetical protein
MLEFKKAFLKEETFRIVCRSKYIRPQFPEEKKPSGSFSQEMKVSQVIKVSQDVAIQKFPRAKLLKSHVQVVEYTRKKARFVQKRNIPKVFFPVTSIAQTRPNLIQVYLVSYIFHVKIPIFLFAIVSDNDC